MRESPKNINELIGVLEALKKDNLNDEYELSNECRKVFQELKILSDFDPSDIKKVVKTLKELPLEIREIEINELSKREEILESKALNRQDLKELVEDYEKAQGKKKETIKKIISERTGKKNVEQFVATQKESAKKLAEEYKKASEGRKDEIKEEIKKRSGEENIEKYIKKSEEVDQRNKERLEKLGEDLGNKVNERLTKINLEESEKVAQVIEKACLDEEINNKEVVKEIKKEIKEKGEIERISKKIVEIRAEIKVERAALEIANNTFSELKEEGLPVRESSKEELKENILKAWEDGEKLEIPNSLRANRDEKAVINAEVAVRVFSQNETESVINYRAEKLENEVAYELRNNGVSDENLIREYTSVVKEINYSTRRIVPEIDKESVVAEINSQIPDGERPKIQAEMAVDEAKWMAGNVVKAPKEFNKLVGQYNQVRDKIGAEKLPRLREIRVTEKMMAMFKNNPGMLRIMNGAQKMAGFWEKFSGGPRNILAMPGVQRLGLGLVEKIGGQAAVSFVKQAATLIAKEGTMQGLKSIATGLVAKGAVGAAAGGGAAGAAALIGGLSAIPGIGWIAAGVIAVAGIFKKIGDKLRNWAKDKLNIDLSGPGSWIGNLLGGGKAGKFLGGAISKVGMFFGALFSNPISIGPLLAIVLVCVLIFMIGSTMGNQHLVSTLVPPPDLSNCVPKEEYSGEINCNQNAPENFVEGVDKNNYIDIANRWTDGTNFASVCYNDVVNRALCAGINPTYALWVWLHESGASNYNRDDIEDFGIHYIPQNRDFKAQITEFLTLNAVGQKCLTDPRINGDFWLSWAVAYLNGLADCNPDKPNSIFPDMTPRKYAAELREQWGWISSAPLPNGYLITPGGQNCDQVNNYDIGSTGYSGNAKEITINGKVYICTETTQNIAGNYDPNAPGLKGVVVEGECSVGDVVVPTRQCDTKWGGIRLAGGACSNGKPGTICSAGCGPTSVSMLMRRVNGSLTPDTVIFSSGSAYSRMGCEGSSLDQAQTELSKKFGSAAITYDATTQGCDEKAIAEWICNGKVVMVLANFYRNSGLELGGHYVMAVGVNNGKIVVQDPYYDVTNTPFDGTVAYGYAHDIRGCLLIDKAAVK